MALHGEIKENARTLATWEAVRLDPKGPIRSPDTVCTYRWTYTVVGTTHGAKDFQQGRLEHRYGDGFARLALRVIATAAVDAAQLIG